MALWMQRMSPTEMPDEDLPVGWHTGRNLKAVVRVQIRRRCCPRFHIDLQAEVAAAARHPPGAATGHGQEDTFGRPAPWTATVGSFLQS